MKHFIYIFCKVENEYLESEYIFCNFFDIYFLLAQIAVI